MNDKYQVKFEAGPMEQTFKFNQAEAGSLENLKKRIDEKFIETVRARFNEMYLQFKDVK